MTSQSDRVLVQAIRENAQPPKPAIPDPKKKAVYDVAWAELYKRYLGRVQAYVRRRLRDQSAVEDVVQNTFVGFEKSLINYDDKRDLQTWLFTIASHKVTDYIRHAGRRRDQSATESDHEMMDHTPDGRQRTASADARSAERVRNEASALAAALTSLVADWKEEGKFAAVMVLELLFVKGFGNNEVAAALRLPEQTIANIKFQAKTRLNNHLRDANLSPAVFPELAEA